MSTIKVTNIQDTSGGNSSTSEEVFQGRAKAWVHFNGGGTLEVMDSFNVTSVTDGGIGHYTINFTNNMPNANYAVTTGSQTVGSNSYAAYDRVQNITTSNILIRCVHTSTFRDFSIVCAAVFGD